VYPPFTVAIPIALGVTAGMDAQSIGWSLAPQQQSSVAGVIAGMDGSPSFFLAAEGTAFAFAGQDARLIRPRVLFADAGAFALGGQDANLLRVAAVVLIADIGAFAFEGQDADGRVPLVVIRGDIGMFALAGQPSVLGAPGAADGITGFDLLSLSEDLLGLRLT
jgi:hypothetical protein